MGSGTQRSAWERREGQDAAGVKSTRRAARRGAGRDLDRRHFFGASSGASFVSPDTRQAFVHRGAARSSACAYSLALKGVVVSGSSLFDCATHSRRGHKARLADRQDGSRAGRREQRQTPIGRHQRDRRRGHGFAGRSLAVSEGARARGLTSIGSFRPGLNRRGPGPKYSRRQFGGWFRREQLVAMRRTTRRRARR